MTTSAGEDYTAEAVRALTAAARQTYTTPAGQQSRYDFGEILCRVVTTVAANLGGVDELLAGRPGSWEADYVRQIVRSTTPEDELGRWRTEPVRIGIDVEGAFSDFGLEDLYEEAAVELDRQVSDGEEALFQAWATDEERICMSVLRHAIRTAEFGKRLPFIEEAEHTWNAAMARAEPTHPLAVAVDWAKTRRSHVEELWARDLADYRAAYLDTIQSILTERGVSAPVEVVEWAELSADEESETFDLEAIARERTPLPMTGEAPDWTNGRPADAVRRAGLTYLNRP